MRSLKVDSIRQLFIQSFFGHYLPDGLPTILQWSARALSQLKLRNLLIHKYALDKMTVGDYLASELPSVAKLGLQTGASLTYLQLDGFGGMTANKLHSIASAFPDLRTIELRRTFWRPEDFENRIGQAERPTPGHEVIVAALSSLPHLVEVNLGIWPICERDKMDSKAWRSVTQYCKTRNFECTMRLLR